MVPREPSARSCGSRFIRSTTYSNFDDEMKCRMMASMASCSVSLGGGMPVNVFTPAVYIAASSCGRLRISTDENARAADDSFRPFAAECTNTSLMNAMMNSRQL